MPSSSQRAAPKQRVDGERRQVTIMYADLSGYTRLSEVLDAEELHTTVGRVLDTIDRIVVDHGGTVHRHIGDEVMALFGAPVAHGDDPYRAVLVAFEIHKAMAALSDEIGRELKVHIGVASGEVVVAGQGEENPKDVPDYAITGVAANLASRLKDLAKPDETIISDIVYGAVERRIQCEPLGEVEVKGLAKPVPIWQAKEIRERPSQRAHDLFVGRRSEMAQFKSVMAACSDTQAGQAILVRGEAGFGKTRLVEEFEASAEHSGFKRHKGWVLDFGAGKGQDAVGTLVASLLDIPAGEKVAAREGAAEQAMLADIYDPDQRVFLNDLLDLPQPDALRGLYNAMDNTRRTEGKKALVVDLIRNLSAQQPRILVVEDIHWSDAATLDYLACIAALVQDCPAILVMTSRIEGDPLDQAWRGATQGSPLITMDLGPLRKQEAFELAGVFRNANDEFVTSCIERAEGSPLFLEQLLRSAGESGSDEVPATIQSLIMSRMDQLPERDKWALQVASVIGQRFALDTLRTLLDDYDYSCVALIQHYLVRREVTDFLFAHALIQEGVYGSLLKAKRNHLHRRAADWFGERDAALRAQHLDRADDPAAPQAYLAAARSESGKYRYDRALQLVERGIEIAVDQTDTYNLMCFRGEILHDLGAISESVAAYEQALSYIDPNDHCLARIGLAAGMRMFDRHDEALSHLEQAESAASLHGLGRELAQIHYLRGNVYFPRGEFERCHEQHSLALKHARVADSPEGEVSGLSGLGDAEYARGRMISANQMFRRCVELSRKHGLGRIEVSNLHMIGFTRLFCNELHEATDDARATIELASKVGDQRAEMLGWTLLFNVFNEMGKAAEISEPLDQCDRLIGSLGARRFEAQNLIYRAKSLRATGQREEALALCRKAITICHETGLGFVGPRTYVEYASNCDDLASQREALDKGEKILLEGAVSHNHFHFYRDAMEVCLNNGDLEEVEQYVAALEQFTKPEPLPWCDLFIARGKALVAFNRGMLDGDNRVELLRIRNEANRVGLGLAVPALDAALAKFENP
ncbi:MAG: adenylate/guanylate cyclase domain-containing protein [Arenicellales bacterium]|nr:adenylate/guanylate cyclase domain-containing protein [Arenicellales bacterium]